MKPSHRLNLKARQTAEQLQRLAGWAERNRALFGPALTALRGDVAATSTRLAALARAADADPAVGVIGAARTRKGQLVAQLLQVAPVQPGAGEIGQRPLDQQSIAALQPVSADRAGVVQLRYTAAVPPPSPRGFPVRATTITTADLVAVVTAVALALNAGGPLPTEAGVAALFDQFEPHLSAEARPGLSETDIAGIRLTLETRWPKAARLKRLAATSFWTRFQEVAAHARPRERRLAFQMLWGFDPAVSALFERLVTVLDKLGDGGDIYLAADALLTKDRATGWLVRHPRSVIAVETLAALRMEPGAAVEVMNRLGQTLEVERAVLAALIAELPLHVATSRLDMLAPADLIEFPTPAAASGVTGELMMRADQRTRQFAAAVDQFARAKALYLFERAVFRHDVTALVAAVDPARADDTFATALGLWVRLAQGGTAKARERVRRGLFFAAASNETAAAARRAQVVGHVSDVLARKDDWARSWTPDRALSEAYLFPPQGDARDQVRALAAAPGAGDGGGGDDTSELISALSQALAPLAKQLQLSQQVQDARRRFRVTLMRHHQSNDPQAAAEWRKQSAVMVQDRMQLLIDQRRLGLMHQALLPDADDIAEALKAYVAAANGQFSLEAAAEAAVSCWLDGVRRAARSPLLGRDLGLEPDILYHVADEMQIGAVRMGLAQEIASEWMGLGGLTQAQEFTIGMSPDVVEQRFAAFACRVIGVFVETLKGVRAERGLSAMSLRAAPLTAYQSAGGGLPVLMGPTAHDGQLAVRRARVRGAAWEGAVAQLVDDNIAAAQFRGRGEQDRELSELMQAFAASPYEVET